MATTGEPPTAVAKRVDREHHVQEVVRLISAGASRGDLIDYAAEHWGLAPRTVDRLIAAAHEQISEAWSMERPQLLAVLLARLEDAAARAVRAGDLRAELAALAMIAKLSRADLGGKVIRDSDYSFGFSSTARAKCFLSAAWDAEAPEADPLD